MKNYVTQKQFKAHCDETNQRFDDLTEVIKDGFSMMDRRFELMEGKLNSTNQLLHQHLRQSDERFRSIETRLA